MAGWVKPRRAKKRHYFHDHVALSICSRCLRFDIPDDELDLNEAPNYLDDCARCQLLIYQLTPER